MLRCRLLMSNKRASCAAYGRARAAYRHQKGAAMTVLVEPFASVYDDRSRLGIFLARGRGGFEAYAADDHSLGLFPSPRKAAAAITTTRPWTAQTTAEESANGANNDCSRAGADKVRPRDQSRDRQKTRPACADEGDRMCNTESLKT